MQKHRREVLRAGAGARSCAAPTMQGQGRAYRGPGEEAPRGSEVKGERRWSEHRGAAKLRNAGGETGIAGCRGAHFFPKKWERVARVQKNVYLCAQITSL